MMKSAPFLGGNETLSSRSLEMPNYEPTPGLKNLMGYSSIRFGSSPYTFIEELLSWNSQREMRKDRAAEGIQFEMGENHDVLKEESYIFNDNFICSCGDATRVARSMRRRMSNSGPK